MKIAKILTIISYLLIPIKGEYLSGPFIMHLLFWFGDGNFWPTIGPLSIFISLLVFAYITFRPRSNRDKFLVPIISILLIFPFARFFQQTMHFFDSKNNLTSAVVFSIFLLLTIGVNVWTIKQPDKSTAGNTWS